MKEYIENRVHELYWKEDINCARTALICLGGLFETVIEPQTIQSAAGLHGAGGYRAQCGLVEGTLMFIGIYLHGLGRTEEEIVSACYGFASAFDRKFGSLRCFEPVDGCYYSVGIHPWKVSEAAPEDWEKLEKAVGHPSVLAIGETGLDKLASADILLQKEAFVRQVLLSESVGKPLVIHCVKAFNELIELKKRYRPQMPWVVHGFRNNLHIACRLMQENIYFSLGERYQIGRAHV